MKNIILVFALLLCFTQFNKAQKVSLMNFGINTDFVSVPLTENSLLINTTIANVGYNISENLNLKLGYEGAIIKENQNMKYANLNGLLLGLGYYLNNKENSDYNTELFVSYTNSFNNFSEFENYHSDFGVRFFYKKMFFIGTALRYSNNNLSISTNKNNLNWYWQMGFQVPIFKNVK
jgi:hypothetical protein